MAEETYDEFDTPEFADEEPAPAPAPVAPPRRAKPAPRRITPQAAAAQAEPMPTQMTQGQQAVQQADQTVAPAARYLPYELPKRIGLLDRVTGKPLIEDEDMLRVIMAQLADIKNDLEEIKSYYN